MHLAGPPLIIMAMEAEAAPVRSSLGLEQAGELLHPMFPALIWETPQVCLAVNGIDRRYGVDSIASQPAAVTTLHAIQRTDPSLVISAGTAGGFARRSGFIGEVCLANRSLFHDRRIRLEGFDEYGNGDYPVKDMSTVGAELGFRMGTVSSGNALDAPVIDIEKMDLSETIAKDMEAAAVAWICEQFAVPFTALKVITDLIDSDEATADQFSRNFVVANERLGEAVKELINMISNKGEVNETRT
jgi:nucleoside phosphorylase